MQFRRQSRLHGPLRALPVLVAGLLLSVPAVRTAAAGAPCVGAVSGAGQATWYAYPPGGGACGLAGDDGEPLVAAISSEDYDGSSMCGRWLRVTGPLGAVTVRIVDSCPSCPAGDLDLNEAAFALIGDLRSGRVPVTWETVAGPGIAPVTIHVSPGSNAHWVALQVRDHRYGVAALEYHGPGGYLAAPRRNDNHFIIDGNLGVPLPIGNPFSVRVTDENGQTLTVAGLYVIPGREFTGGDQFPLCSEEPSPVGPFPARLRLALRPPAPSPFHPRITLVFELPVRAPVRLRVLDAAGRLVTVLLDGVTMDEGRHAIVWNGCDAAGKAVAGGQYRLRMEAAGQVAVQRALLIR